MGEDKIDKIVIGPWTVTPESGLLSNGNGKEIYLEVRLAKLFWLLGKTPNTLLPRKTLIDQIWNDTIVNEESLTKAISDLKKVLKMHFDNPPQIKTIPKRGYKMVISTATSKKTASWKVILKYFIYFLLAFTLITLIIRDSIISI